MDTITIEEAKIIDSETCDVFLCYDGTYYFLKKKDYTGEVETSTPFFNAVFLIDSWSKGTLEFSE